MSKSGALRPTQVHIFDWGRSELLSQEEYAALPAEEQELRRTFWDFYCKGVRRQGPCHRKWTWTTATRGRTTF